MFFVHVSGGKAQFAKLTHRDVLEFFLSKLFFVPGFLLEFFSRNAHCVAVLVSIVSKKLLKWITKNLEFANTYSKSVQNLDVQNPKMSEIRTDTS